MMDHRSTRPMALDQPSADNNEMRTRFGKHCEAGDILVRDVYLPGDVSPGDVIAVPGAGAYSRSMASNYNHVPRPAVVRVGIGDHPDTSVLLRRESIDDLLSLDPGPVKSEVQWP